MGWMLTALPWGSISPNGSINLLVDLGWEDFTSGSCWASQEHLELESTFQQNFYTELLLLGGKLLVRAVCKVKVGPPWNQAVWHVEITMRKVLILKLAFILVVEGTPVFVVGHSSNHHRSWTFLG